MRCHPNRWGEGVEEDGARAVFPRGLEAVPHPSVVLKFESVLGEGRPSDIATEALESLALATVHDDVGVDVDPADFGDGVTRGGGPDKRRADELRGLVSRRGAKELEVLGGGGVAGGEDRGVVVERVVPGLVAHTVEGPTVTAEHAEHPGRRIEREGWANAEAMTVAPDGSGFEPQSLDRFLIVNTWHHIDRRVSYARTLAESLRPEGRVVVVDFTMEGDRGPSLEVRILPETVVAELQEAGFRSYLAEESLPDQYVVIGQR